MAPPRPDAVAAATAEAARGLPEAPLAEALDRLAAPVLVPGGGSGAALAAAVAASLVAKVARLSPGWPDAGGTVAQAEALRARALLLADADAAAYGDALERLRAPADDDPRERDAELAEALARAAEVPLVIAETACDVTLLAAEASECGEPAVAADAGVAALLADGAVRSGCRLVSVNLATAPGNERAARGDDLAAASRAAVRRALAVSG